MYVKEESESSLFKAKGCQEIITWTQNIDLLVSRTSAKRLSIGRRLMICSFQGSLRRDYHHIAVNFKEHC